VRDPSNRIRGGSVWWGSVRLALPIVVRPEGGGDLAGIPRRETVRLGSDQAFVTLLCRELTVARADTMAPCCQEIAWLKWLPAK
jgi:hypothetical protein